MLDLAFNLASRFLHPYAWFNPHFSFLFPSPTLSPLLVSLPSTFNPCRDPSFPPSRQPFSALYNLLKDSSLIFHHPSTSSAPPFTWRPFLRISTLWNTTNNVSPTCHRVHVSTKVSGYLPPSWSSFGEEMSSVFVENNEFYSDSKMLLNFIKSFEELILYFFGAVSSQYSSSWRQKQWYTFILHNLWIKLLI